MVMVAKDRASSAPDASFRCPRRRRRAILADARAKRGNERSKRELNYSNEKRRGRLGGNSAGTAHERRDGPARRGPHRKDGESTAATCSETLRSRMSKRTMLRWMMASVALMETHAFEGGPAFAASTSKPLRVPSRMSIALPRDGVIALRRALPRLDPDLGEASSQIDEALRLLRIPQRKPFDDVARCADRSAAALERARGSLRSLNIVDNLDEIAATAINSTREMNRAATSRDASRTTSYAVAAQEQIASLLIGITPDLPFLLPSRFSGLPRCTGRAEVGLTILTGNSQPKQLGEDETIDVVITVDGFNAPITAGSFLKNVSDGVYDGLRLQKFDSSNAIVAAVSKAPSSVSHSLPSSLALEMSVMGESEPRYNEPLDIQGADEYPRLPLSVYGAVAMSHPSPELPQLSSSTDFFVYLHDRSTAGLGGLSFEEGNFAVFGYITSGADLLDGIKVRSRHFFFLDFPSCLRVREGRLSALRRRTTRNFKFN